MSGSDLKSALDRADDAALAAMRGLNTLMLSKRAGRRSLAALATDFRRAADLIDEAAALLTPAQSEGTPTSD